MPQADDWMPFVIGFVIFLIPIIAILTSHQQKMARIFRENQPAGETNDAAALRAEIARLTQAVHQNTIAIDALVQRQSLGPGPMLAGQEPPQIVETSQPL